MGHVIKTGGGETNYCFQNFLGGRIPFIFIIMFYVRPRTVTDCRAWNGGAISERWEIDGDPVGVCLWEVTKQIKKLRVGVPVEIRTVVCAWRIRKPQEYRLYWSKRKKIDMIWNECVVQEEAAIGKAQEEEWEEK
jgi:hypothetical protein